MDALLVDSSLDAHSQVSSFSDYLYEPSKCGEYSSKLFSDLRIQGEVIKDGRVEVVEFMDHLQLVDGCGWGLDTMA